MKLLALFPDAKTLESAQLSLTESGHGQAIKRVIESKSNHAHQHALGSPSPSFDAATAMNRTANSTPQSNDVSDALHALHLQAELQAFFEDSVRDGASLMIIESTLDLTHKLESAGAERVHKLKR